MKMEIEENFKWTENSTNICYYESLDDGSTAVQFCGKKDQCSYIGMVLPLFMELTWPWQMRAALYLIGLLYRLAVLPSTSNSTQIFFSFFGISIVSDLFMGAVEKITSSTKKITLASSGEDAPEVIEVPIWNGTVANITLMTLGSSAPEICLAIIGIIGNNFESNPLGPGTIVGSAAYNLLAISAVCVFAIPDGETRR